MELKENSMSTSESQSPGHRVCELCKQTFADTDGKERAHYSGMGLLTVVHIPRKVFVCHACAARWSPAFKVVMGVLGVILAFVFGAALLGILMGPKK
jgi:hypothetical protein